MSSKINSLFLALCVIFLVSCQQDFERDYSGFFEVKDSVINVSSVIYDWEWTKKRGNEITADFKRVSHTTNSESGSVAYSLINTGGFIKSTYTYKNGKPDYNPAYRAWIVKYSGEALMVEVNWSGELKQITGKGESEVEILFQIYGDDNWATYSNNIRPQVEVDTLFLGFADQEEIRDQLREEARYRMIARYYKSSIDLSGGASVKVSPDDGYPLEFLLNPETTYYMQLFVSIVNKSDDRTAHYEITDGELEIRYIY